MSNGFLTNTTVTGTPGLGAGTNLRDNNVDNNNNTSDDEGELAGAASSLEDAGIEVVAGAGSNLNVVVDPDDQITGTTDNVVVGEITGQITDQNEYNARFSSSPKAKY